MEARAEGALRQALMVVFPDLKPEVAKESLVVRREVSGAVEGHIKGLYVVIGEALQPQYGLCSDAKGGISQVDAASMLFKLVTNYSSPWDFLRDGENKVATNKRIAQACVRAQRAWSKSPEDARINSEYVLCLHLDCCTSLPVPMRPHYTCLPYTVLT